MDQDIDFHSTASPILEPTSSSSPIHTEPTSSSSPIHTEPTSSSSPIHTEPTSLSLADVIHFSSELLYGENINSDPRREFF